MAEKYGVIPPKFTKEWWSYFWTYYKWHVIVPLLIIIGVTVTVVQRVNSPKYDLTVTYNGTKTYSDEEANALTEIMNGYIDDVDGNGEKSVYFQQLVFSDSQTEPQYNYAIQTKLMLEFQNDCSFIFIMDDQTVSGLINSSATEGVFVPVSEWAQSDVDSELLYPQYPEGCEAYAVNLKNSKILKEKGIPCNNIYVALYRNNKTDEENTAAFESSKRILNALIQ
jgi:hypothetical protein